jgi:transposase
VLCRRLARREQLLRSLLELPLEERESVDGGIRHIEFLDSEIAAAERLIDQQARGWPKIRRLMTVPGVNLICAATLIAAVGTRAASCRVASWWPTSAWTPRSASPGTRRRAGPDQQTRLGGRALGAGRGRLERRPATWAAARLL